MLASQSYKNSVIMKKDALRAVLEKHYKYMYFYIFSEQVCKYEFAGNQCAISENYHKIITFATPHSRAFQYASRHSSCFDRLRVLKRLKISYLIGASITTLSLLQK